MSTAVESRDPGLSKTSEIFKIGPIAKKLQHFKVGSTFLDFENHDFAKFKNHDFRKFKITVFNIFSNHGFKFFDFDFQKS